MFVTSAHAQEAKPADPAHPPAQGVTPAVDGHAAPAADGHTTSTEHGAPGAPVIFPPFDTSYYPSQLLWLAITFGLFYLFLKKTVLPRIGHILEVRRDRIANDLDQAARMKEEADAAAVAYEQELTAARAKANGIGQEARDKAKADAEVERKKIEASLDQKLADAEARIAGIKSKAMGEVGSIAESTTAAILEQLTGGKFDKAAVSAAIKSVRN